MKNSSDEIYINGDYFRNNPGWAIEDAPWKADIIFKLLQKNKIDCRKIIEVGCGAGGILEQLCFKSSDFTELLGYDISPQAISLARARENNRLKFKNEDFLQRSQETCDLLLVIDVLEHVDNFYQFLRAVRTQSKNFIFHVPLDLSCRTILKPHVMLQQREAVGHIHYFSKEMVLWFLQDTGYKVVDWVYTKPVVDTRPSDSFKREVKKILRNFSFSLRKDLSAKLWGGYSMMILAKQV